MTWFDNMWLVNVVLYKGYDVAKCLMCDQGVINSTGTETPRIFSFS